MEFSATLNLIVCVAPNNVLSMQKLIQNIAIYVNYVIRDSQSYRYLTNLQFRIRCDVISVLIVFLNYAIKFQNYL